MELKKQLNLLRFQKMAIRPSIVSLNTNKKKQKKMMLLGLFNVMSDKEDSPKELKQIEEQKNNKLNRSQVRKQQEESLHNVFRKSIQKRKSFLQDNSILTAENVKKLSSLRKPKKNLSAMESNSVKSEPPESNQLQKANSAFTTTLKREVSKFELKTPVGKKERSCSFLGVLPGQMGIKSSLFKKDYDTDNSSDSSSSDSGISSAQTNKFLFKTADQAQDRRIRDPNNPLKALQDRIEKIEKILNPISIKTRFHLPNLQKGEESTKRNKSGFGFKLNDNYGFSPKLMKKLKNLQIPKLNIIQKERLQFLRSSRISPKTTRAKLYKSKSKSKENMKLSIEPISKNSQGSFGMPEQFVSQTYHFHQKQVSSEYYKRNSPTQNNQKKVQIRKNPPNKPHKSTSATPDIFQKKPPSLNDTPLSEKTQRTPTFVTPKYKIRQISTTKSEIASLPRLNGKRTAKLQKDVPRINIQENKQTESIPLSSNYHSISTANLKTEFLSKNQIGDEYFEKIVTSARRQNSHKKINLNINLNVTGKVKLNFQINRENPSKSTKKKTMRGFYAKKFPTLVHLHKK